MALVQLQIDLNEVRAIREALQDIAVLLRAKLLADGYLQPPPERVPSTREDVSVGESRLWEAKQQQEKQERRQREGLTAPSLMETGFLSPPYESSGSLNSLGEDDLGSSERA